MKITILSWNEKYQLRYELDRYEQMFKFDSESHSLDEVKAISNDIRVHTGPYGPIWAHMGGQRGEKNNVINVKTILSDSDFFLGLCHEDFAMHPAPRGS